MKSSIFLSKQNLKLLQKYISYMYEFCNVVMYVYTSSLRTSNKRLDKQSEMARTYTYMYLLTEAPRPPLPLQGILPHGTSIPKLSPWQLRNLT